MATLYRTTGTNTGLWTVQNGRIVTSGIDNLAQQAIANNDPLAQAWIKQFPNWSIQNGQLVQTGKSGTGDRVPVQSDLDVLAAQVLKKNYGIDINSIPYQDQSSIVPSLISQAGISSGLSNLFLSPYEGTNAGQNKYGIQTINVNDLLKYGGFSPTNQLPVNQVGLVQTALTSSNQQNSQGIAYLQNQVGDWIAVPAGTPGSVTQIPGSSQNQQNLPPTNQGNNQLTTPPPGYAYMQNQTGDWITVPAGTPGSVTTLPGGSIGTVQNSGAGNPPTTFQSTGNAQLDSLLQTLQGYLDKLKANGQVLNPNIEITPEKAAEFLKQAEGEINPYYQSQTALARESLLRSAGYSADNITNFEKQLEQQYGQQVRQIGENAAEQGFAQSGIRGRQEQQLAQNTQNQIDTNRRQLSFDIGTQARNFAQNFGTDQLPTLDIGAAPQVNPGTLSFTRPNSTSPFYSLSPDLYGNIVGTQEFNRRAAVQNRQSQLESAFRTNAAIQQARKLSL